MSNVDPSRIGETLKAARARLGWSRETLAHHSGVSWSAIAQIESGRRRDVRLSSLSALAEALGVSVDYLIGSAKVTAPQLLEHRLLTYGSEEEYLAAAIPFFAEGIERSECLLAVTTRDRPGSCANRSRRAGDVEFADSGGVVSLARTAMRRLPHIRQREDRGGSGLDPDRRRDRPGEPVDAEEIAAWNRYEAFVNLAFASAPTTFI